MLGSHAHAALCSCLLQLAKAASSEMVDSVNAVQDALAAALAQAERDNNTVYLERVPPFAEAGVQIQVSCSWLCRCRGTTGSCCTPEAKVVGPGALVTPCHVV
jgi:hypothetical protein